MKMMRMGLEGSAEVDTYDFADKTVSRQLHAEGVTLANSGFVPPPVPIDVLFLLRKFAGIFLIAANMKAKLPLREIAAPFLRDAQSSAAV